MYNKFVSKFSFCTVGHSEWKKESKRKRFRADHVRDAATAAVIAAIRPRVRNWKIADVLCCMFDSINELQSSNSNNKIQHKHSLNNDEKYKRAQNDCFAIVAIILFSFLISYRSCLFVCLFACVCVFRVMLVLAGFCFFIFLVDGISKRLPFYTHRHYKALYRL